MAVQNRDNILLCDFTQDLQGFAGNGTMIAYVTSVSVADGTFDGQGGWFYWNGSSLQPQDFVNSIDPSNNHGGIGRWLRIPGGGGSGSLTQVATGAGLAATPNNPITLTGTISLNQIPGGGQVLANLAGGMAVPSPAQMTAVLDANFGAPSPQGGILVRGATSWAALAPGATGNVLTMSSAAPIWQAGGTGTVTSVGAGGGLALLAGGSSFGVSGTLQLASVPANTILGQSSGGGGIPAPFSLSQYMDSAFSAAGGAIAVRGGNAWQGLAPGTAGQLLTVLASGLGWTTVAQGGTVTRVNTGAGLTGGPITASGTVALAQVSGNNILANATGVVGAPLPTPPSAIFDNAFGAAAGNILYRSASAWVSLPPGSNGQQLTLSSGLPSWGASGSGSVTLINAGSGIAISSGSGGTITTTGFVNLAAAAGYSVLANASGATQVPVPTSISSVLDEMIGATTGAIIYRAAGSWNSLAIGSNGQVLTATAGVPAWGATSGTGTVSSVALSVPPIFNVSGSPITGAGTLGVSVVAQGSGLFWAGSSGSSVTTTPSFRAFANSDFPINPHFTGNGSFTGGLSAGGNLAAFQMNASSSLSATNASFTGQVAINSSANVSGYFSMDAGVNVAVYNLTSSVSTYNIVSQQQYIIAVAMVSAVAVNINLPSSPAQGDTYEVKDALGVTQNFPITVVATSGTIDGSGSFVFLNNFQATSFTARLAGGPWMVA